VDGIGGQLQFRRRLREDWGVADPAPFVADDWSPSSVAMYDKNARDDGAEVPLSSSEQACALSHVAAWRGVAATLDEDTAADPGGMELRFRISGYACGPPLGSADGDVGACAPVCVVLEDDAVLCDRFSEKLGTLLKELPSDFHFCALGYSRPAVAPAPEYSPTLCVPSFLWYLTGYVLSADGARELLESLPVVGPVDSWIGKKMANNGWRRKGDGLIPKVPTTLPDREELHDILKFRSFASRVPLCSQKVGSRLQDDAPKLGWRERDTDITYSGFKI